MKTNPKIAALTLFFSITALTTSGAFAKEDQMTMKEMKIKKGHTLLLKSALENADLTEVTLPIFEGKRGSETVFYVVTESSNKDDAARRGVHFAPKLSNAKGSNAVEKVKRVNGMIEFTGSVIFTPVRSVIPGPTGFPPTEAKPGAIAEAGYTPLVELPDGTVLNAPHVKNSTGEHDRTVSIDVKNKKGTFKMTQGFFEGKIVHYTSFNASDPGVAAVEAATYTPRLAATPSKGSNGPNSALIGLIPFANGQTGKMNPARQGLSSALMGEGDPFNIVQEIPFGERALLYTPMWDVHIAVWKTEAITAKSNTAQMDFNTVVGLAKEGRVTGPEGMPWGAIGVVVNCPIVSIDQ
jgi:hypothetical protein